MIRFIQPPWENYFLTKVRESESSIFLISPYIKCSVAALISAVLQTKQNSNLSIKILTRIDIHDINEGASDLEAYEQLLQLSEHKGKELSMKYISNLHAKVYIFDNKSAIVTSSNLTPSGMKSNIEYGVEILNPYYIQQIRSEMNEYWIKANTVTQQIINDIHNRLTTFESIVNIAPEPIQKPVYSASSTSEVPSIATAIINKRLKPQGQDIELVELDNLRDSLSLIKSKRMGKTKVIVSIPTEFIASGGENDIPNKSDEDLSEQERVIEIESSYEELEQYSVEDIINELNSDDEVARKEALKRLKILYVLDKHNVLPYVDELALALSKTVIRNPHSCYRLLRIMHDTSMVSLSIKVMEIVKDKQGILPWPLLKNLYRLSPNSLESLLYKAVREPLSSKSKKEAIYYLSELNRKLKDNKSVIAALKYLTTDNDYRISGLAYMYLGKTQGAESHDYLVDSWEHSTSQTPLSVKVNILQGIIEAGLIDKDREFFARLTESCNDQFRSIAIKALQQFGRTYWDLLIHMAKSDPVAKVRSEAIRGLVNIDQTSSHRLLAELVDSEFESSVKRTIHEQLNRLNYESFKDLSTAEKNSILEAKLEELHSNERSVRLKAARFFGKIQEPSTIQALHNALEDEDGIVRAVVAEALGDIGDKISFNPLVKVLEYDSYYHARAAAAKALGRIGDKSAIPILRKSLDDNSGYVRKWADWSLDVLGNIE